MIPSPSQYLSTGFNLTFTRINRKQLLCPTMRSSPEIPALPRKPPFDPPSQSLDPRTAAPATFFLSRNPDADDSAPGSAAEDPGDSGDCKEGMYGVQSLADMLSQSESSVCPSGDIPTHPQPINNQLQDDEDYKEGLYSRRRSTLKPCEPVSRDSSVQPSINILSRPLTPLIPDDPSSLPSSPKSLSNQSFRPLDDISITDEISSQAVGSDEEEKPGLSPNLGPVNVSQLIMPSIKMPSRRPFTEKGKAMGRFKILLAGPPGMKNNAACCLNITDPTYRFWQNIPDQVNCPEL